MRKFESAYLKIARAQQHVIELTEAVRAYEKSQPYEFVGKQHPNRWRAEHLHVRTRPPIHLTLMAGDAMHNARAALDHAVFDISRARGRARERVYFPLYTNRIDYLKAQQAGRWKRALTGVEPEYVALIEREQPFRRRNRRLGALATFDNIDKHRTVHPTFARNAAIPVLSVLEGSLENVTIRYWPLGKRMEEGAEIVAMHSTAGKGNPRVVVKVNLAVTVAFGGRSLTVDQMRELVRRTEATHRVPALPACED